jgi:hypothetical protein
MRLQRPAKFVDFLFDQIEQSFAKQHLLQAMNPFRFIE